MERHQQAEQLSLKNIKMSKNEEENFELISTLFDNKDFISQKAESFSKE